MRPLSSSGARRAPANEPNPDGATASPPSRMGAAAVITFAAPRQSIATIDVRPCAGPLTSSRWSNLPVVSKAIPFSDSTPATVTNGSVTPDGLTRVTPYGGCRRRMNTSSRAKSQAAPATCNPGETVRYASAPASSAYPAGPRANGVTAPAPSTRKSCPEPATTSRPSDRGPTTSNTPGMCCQCSHAGPAASAGVKPAASRRTRAATAARPNAIDPILAPIRAGRSPALSRETLTDCRRNLPSAFEYGSVRLGADAPLCHPHPGADAGRDRAQHRARLDRSAGVEATDLPRLRGYCPHRRACRAARRRGHRRPDKPHLGLRPAPALAGAHCRPFRHHSRGDRLAGRLVGMAGRLPQPPRRRSALAALRPGRRRRRRAGHRIYLQPGLYPPGRDQRL